MKPHVHISALQGLVFLLMYLAIIGTLNHIAIKYQGRSKLLATYANTFGLN
jgi:hypothetical protein